LIQGGTVFPKQNQFTRCVDLKPRDIDPPIFTTSARKNFIFNKGITNEFRMAKIITSSGLSLRHISKFVDLWTWISEINLAEGTTEKIIWKFTTLGEYSEASAYKG
jgi:hypothetical protein